MQIKVLKSRPNTEVLRTVCYRKKYVDSADELDINRFTINRVLTNNKLSSKRFLV